MHRVIVWCRGKSVGKAMLGGNTEAIMQEEGENKGDHVGGKSR